MSRQIGAVKSKPIETKSSVDALTRTILATFQTKPEIVSAFQQNGFSISDKSDREFLAYKKANSGGMHFSIRIEEDENGFSCSEIRAMGIGL